MKPLRNVETPNGFFLATSLYVCVGAYMNVFVCRSVYQSNSLSLTCRSFSSIPRTCMAFPSLTPASRFVYFCNRIRGRYPVWQELNQVRHFARMR